MICEADAHGCTDCASLLTISKVVVARLVLCMVEIPQYTTTLLAPAFINGLPYDHHTPHENFSCSAVTSCTGGIEQFMCY